MVGGGIPVLVSNDKGHMLKPVGSTEVLSILFFFDNDVTGDHRAAGTATPLRDL